MIAAHAGRSASSGLQNAFDLLRDGVALMRERWFVYAALAAVCGVAGINGTVDLYHIDRLMSLRVVMVFALVALYFVLPAAVRRIDPGFRMTLWRIAIATVMIALVGLMVEVGCAVAFVPGVIAGVLLSQALLTAILRVDERRSVRSFAAAIAESFRESYRLTRHHFATTLGVLTLSLLILAVPFFAGLLGLVIAGYVEPKSLVVTGPALFLIFVYFECVRYSLIVRWYGRLRAAD